MGIVMDPIESIRPYKDTSFAMLLEAQRRGHAVQYYQPRDLSIIDGVAWGRGRPLRVVDRDTDYFELGDAADAPLADLDLLLLRKDPPFDMDYVYLTYLLERAEAAGTLVVNRPGAVRDCNEKLAITAYPELCPATRVDADMARLRSFLAEHRDIILKPLDGMGGASIFRLRAEDPNAGVILETLTAHGSRLAMAQAFLPSISEGDKRILLIDGEPWPQTLARIPAAGENRGNLAAGGRGEGRDLTDAERAICARVGPDLKAAGLIFVGLDAIGGRLTEINVTSPTCVRELDAIYGSNICATLFDAIEARLAAA